MTKPKGPTANERAQRHLQLQQRIKIMFDLLTEAQMELKVLERTMFERNELEQPG